MTCFHEIGSGLQIFLLVLSQLAVIALAGGCALALRYKYGIWKQVRMDLCLLVNVAAYVAMQLDSRISGSVDTARLHIPYGLLLLFLLLSLGYAVWALLRETKNRKTINDSSIKESFDNLPTGVCFFNEAGLPVLCNRAMHRFSFAVSGKDVQFISDLEDCLAEDFAPTENIRRDGKVFMLPDGCAWRLEKSIFPYRNGAIYTQFISTDVSELQRTRMELTEETAQLRRVQSDLKRLSANVVAITREEEILNTKMRVHDEIGRCLVEAQTYLRDGCKESIPEHVVTSWQRAVSMLKYNNETTDEDMLSQIRKSCESMNLRLIQSGQPPENEGAAYILTCAVRECVTNAVRYAGAKELYVSFSETEGAATVTVSNSGKQPDSEIVEGGGLSTLRRRVEREGGSMLVQSRPCFQLTVSVPKGKENGM